MCALLKGDVIVAGAAGGWGSDQLLSKVSPGQETVTVTPVALLDSLITFQACVGLHPIWPIHIPRTLCITFFLLYLIELDEERKERKPTFL